MWTDAAPAGRRAGDGLTTNQLNEILKGKRGVTPETAIGALTKTGPQMWLAAYAG